MIGSNWQFTELYNAQSFSSVESVSVADSAVNLGGSQFTKTKELNPLLRVKTPKQVDNDSVLPDQNERQYAASESKESEVATDYVYATGTFDKQQSEASGSELKRNRDYRVPKLDERLTVAFQKFLRNEELEFLMLVCALETGNQL